MDGENWLSGGEGVHKAQGILFPQPGIEPVLLAVKTWSLNHCTTKEVLKTDFLK